MRVAIVGATGNVERGVVYLRGEVKRLTTGAGPKEDLGSGDTPMGLSAGLAEFIVESDFLAGRVAPFDTFLRN